MNYSDSVRLSQSLSLSVCLVVSVCLLSDFFLSLSLSLSSSGFDVSSTLAKRLDRKGKDSRRLGTHFDVEGGKSYERVREDEKKASRMKDGGRVGKCNGYHEEVREDAK